jgi:hypothetical protein
MEHLTSDLESAAHPALDAIISKVCFLLPGCAAAQRRRLCCNPGVLQRAWAARSAVQNYPKYRWSQKRAEPEHISFGVLCRDISIHSTSSSLILLLSIGPVVDGAATGQAADHQKPHGPPQHPRRDGALHGLCKLAAPCCGHSAEAVPDTVSNLFLFLLSAFDVLQCRSGSSSRRCWMMMMTCAT